MIENIKGIRDLLAWSIANDLDTFISREAQRGRVFLQVDRETLETFAFAVVDSITPKSLELLAERHAKSTH